MGKFIKKAISALLASIMCIPTGILSIANATEMESNGEYTVNLTETEGGFMQFTDDCLISSTASQEGYQMVQIDEKGELSEVENDGTIWAFKKGDLVEIELIPDEGYQVSSFMIKDMNTEKVLAQKDTSDNFFQFVMPAKNVVITATFSDGSISSIPIVDESGNTNNGDSENSSAIEYQDITETGEISKAEVEEVLTDVITENYIKSHLNEEYVTIGDDIKLANVLLVKNTMFDGQYVEDDDTIDSIMYSIQDGDENMEANLQKVLGQVSAYTMVYSLNDESDYYVTFANTMMKDTEYTVQDVIFAIADESGTTVDGCIYDAETGLVYIPKTLYNDGEDENIFMYLQVQFMQILNKRTRNMEMESEVHALSVDENNETIELQSSTQSILNLETVVNVATGMNADNLNVFVNGVLLPETMYAYDSENGKLTIYMSSASVVSVEVSEGEESLSDKLIEFMTDDVKAATAEEMQVGKVVDIDDPNDLPPVGWNRTVTIATQYINNSTNMNKNYIYGSGNPDQAIQMIEKIMNNGITVSVQKSGKYFDIVPDFSEYTGEYESFFKQLGKIYLVCAHTDVDAESPYYDQYGNWTNPLGSSPSGNSYAGKVRISVVKKDVTVESDGTLTGYLILGFVTSETHNQTGIGYVKVSFGTEPPPEQTITPRDPVRLYIYKVSEDGNELDSATLAGSKFEIIFHPDVHCTSAEEFINNGYGTTSWIFQTKIAPDVYLHYFEGASQLGMIDTTDASYLAPDSPTKDLLGFGYKGSYLIREVKAPDGFLLEGFMQDYYTGNNTNDISNIGLVYYIDADEHITECNGHIIPGLNGTVEVGNLPDQALVVHEKSDVPSIETQSSVEDTGSQYGDATSHNVTCVDEVHISNLREQTMYTLETYLVDIATGAKIAGTDTTTIIDTRTYTEKNWHGRIRINIDPVSLGLADHTLMFVNKLYDPEQGEPIAVSDDLGMVNEYVYFPNSGTLALDRETGKHITYTGHNTNNIDDPINFAQGTERATVIDEIWYKNLQAGKQYRIEAWMVDTDTGSPADDGNGSPIVISSESKYFTPEEADGTVNITFSFDVNQSIAGRKYVIFSEIYLNDELVSSHRDINDEKEMIWLPKITTNLTDNETGTDITYAKGTVRINDQVDYSRMKPGETYMIKGTLYNMNTKEVLLDDNGNEVTTTQTFTPASEYGSWNICYEFPADILAGTVSVSYVEVYVKDNEGNWVIVAEHKDFWDKNQRNYMPYIDTTALDQKTAHHISYAEKTMKLYDTVHYEALHPEYTYKLVSELRDVATGEIVTDDAGVRQVVTSYFKADFDMLDNQFLTYGDIIPENHEGSGITFDVDAEYFAGRTLVVYERLYFENEYSEEYLIAEHQELLDDEQTIHVPKIWTSAIDSDTFTKTSFADNSTTIIDTVSYENLIPDLTYELKGYIIDKNQSVQTGTNVVATGTNGKLAENSLVFTPEKSSGAVKLSFEIDTSKFGTEDYNGMVFVVYEELYVVDRYDDADHRCLVATHTDIADVNQTVYVPRITTSLNDGKSGSKILLAEKNVHLTDTVDYYRFQPSTDYTIKGKLIDMETGDVLIDSKGNRVEKTVTVTSSATGTGSWTVDYEFDATELQGRVIVAYADVYVKNGERNDILSPVASHNDFWDEEQRVYIPVISTVATDQKTNSHITYAEENVWITDRIYYSFLKPETEYKLISKLVDKETGEVVVDDKGITQQIESTFTTTPNESQERYNQIISNPFTDSSDTGIGYSYGYVIPADGTTLPDGSDYHGVVFTLDAHTFEGRTLVIYEELQVKVNNEYYTIASHMDRNDENQTVHIPKIRTNAVDSETLTHTSKMDGQMTVIDTVSYENLIPGFTYVLEGYLMDKPRDDTKGYGKIKDKDGNYITNTIEFTPDKPNGTVKLSLSGNASEFQTDEGAFSSETLVVFERLYLKDNKDASDEWLIVANHENINDENQTIYCPRISTKVVSYDLGEEAKEGEADYRRGR